MAEYIIQGETLTAIANAIRTKKENTAIFTPAQMADEIQSIVTNSDEMPNAEDVRFGMIGDVVEYGILNESISYSTNLGQNRGYRFTMVETMACIGIRARFNYAKNNERYLRLWDAETQTAIEALTVNCDVEDEWVEYRFSEPINLFAGKTYAVSIRGNGLSYSNSSVIFNPKLTNTEWAYAESEDGCPTQPVSQCYGVDIILKEALTESNVTEYKIQAATMDDITVEVQRLTGASGKLTTAQIITALQGLNVTLQDKTVTPTEEVQTVTPDSGYYGLSSVTVEAIPATESETTE